MICNNKLFYKRKLTSQEKLLHCYMADYTKTCPYPKRKSLMRGVFDALRKLFI